MPKVKTHKMAAKRFKVTKTGKILKRVQGSRHLRIKKSKRRIRRFNEPVALGAKQAKVIKRLLNI